MARTFGMFPDTRIGGFPLFVGNRQVQISNAGVAVSIRAMPCHYFAHTP
jgi:hypothetical protein